MRGVCPNKLSLIENCVPKARNNFLKIGRNNRASKNDLGKNIRTT
jgi:hypothetical protein